MKSYKIYAGLAINGKVYQCAAEFDSYEHAMDFARNAAKDAFYEQLGSGEMPSYSSYERKAKEEFWDGGIIDIEPGMLENATIQIIENEIENWIDYDAIDCNLDHDDC
jgi:hypothetical protein